MLSPRWPQWSLARVAVLGTAGSVAIAASSWWVAAVPFSYQSAPPAALSGLPIGSILPRTVFYLGLSGLGFAWLLAARRVLNNAGPVDTRHVVALILGWALPFMAAMPLSSRDLWSYVAQGNLAHHGLDPYSVSPRALTGPFLDNVSPRWIDASAPYGPLALMTGHLVAVICGGHVVLAVFLTRMSTLAGLLLTVFSVHGIAARLARRADRALILGLANPLTLVLGLGGGHNDLVMTGLLVTGVLALLGPGGIARTLGLGAALMAAAVAVKSPAVIGLAFTVPIWLWAPGRSRRSTVRTVLGAGALALGCAASSFTLISLVSGYGLGWVTQVTTSEPIVSWMSLPTSAAILAKLLSGTVAGSTRLDHTMQLYRTAGLALAALLVAGLWVVAVLDAADDHSTNPPGRQTGTFPRLSPPAALVAALIAVVLLGPTVQPWYFCWSLPLLALLTLPRGLLMGLLGASLGLVVMIAPGGRGSQMSPLILVVIAGSALVGCLALRGVPEDRPRRTGESVARDDDPDRARSRVRPDGRPEL